MPMPNAEGEGVYTSRTAADPDRATHPFGALRCAAIPELNHRAGRRVHLDYAYAQVLRDRMQSRGLTPRGGFVIGSIFVASGLIPILAGLGVIPMRMSPGIQPWVVVAAGSMFAMAGLSMINAYGLGGGIEQDGDLAASVPYALRVAQYLLGLAILGLMFTVFAWVAVGSGERHFSSWMTFAGHRSRSPSSALSGRIAFGACAAFLGLFFVLSAIAGARRLRDTSTRAGN